MKGQDPALNSRVGRGVALAVAGVLALAMGGWGGLWSMQATKARPPAKRTETKARPPAKRTETKAAASPKAATKAAVKGSAQALTAEETKLAAAGQRYESGKRRDPFRNLVREKEKTDPKGPMIDEPVWGAPPPGIAGMYMAQIDFLGTSLREGSYTAVFRGTDKRYYFLRENDRVFDGFIKKIQGDSVTLSREVRMRSGKVERSEVTKQLRRQN